MTAHSGRPHHLDQPFAVVRWAVIALVLLLAAYWGRRPSLRWLELLIAGAAALALLRNPFLGLPGAVALALVAPWQIATGGQFNPLSVAQVKLNPVSLFVPVMLVIWAFDMMRRRALRPAPSPANLPLLLFLTAGLFSLLVGIATWDPAVPRADRFLLVQLAQWAIFAFSAGAFWLTASLIGSEEQLKRLTWLFLILAGSVAILSILPGGSAIVARVATLAFIRPPLWVLVVSLAGGQLLFNRSLSRLAQGFLALVLLITVIRTFGAEREAASNWVGVGAALGILFWLRFPRSRAAMTVIVALLVVTGILFPSVYNFAGGDTEWDISGGSRLTLIQRVVEVTMRNPITGLGPAAYRPYANMRPLAYGRAYWVAPQINSHNNYVDLFAHVGVLGLALFFWFVLSVAQTGVRVRKRFSPGFAAGFANGMLAASAGSLVIMMLADWMLPFIYNIGFDGFQASVLVWLFLGGLVALEQIANQKNGD